MSGEVSVAYYLHFKIRSFKPQDPSVEKNGGGGDSFASMCSFWKKTFWWFIYKVTKYQSEIQYTIYKNIKIEG